jgi:hypothetical protein
MEDFTGVDVLEGIDVEALMQVLRKKPAPPPLCQLNPLRMFVA